MIIGVDVGYGYTKSVADNGQRAIFPSVVGTGFERKMERMMYEGIINDSDNYDLVVRNGDERRRYFVGNLALLHSRDATRPFSDERDTPEEIKPQLLAAVGSLCQNEPVTLVTGLPLEPFSKYARSLKSSLERLSGAEVILNNNPVAIKFESVILFPQAVAALYGQLLRSKNGPAGAVGLVDVGFRTTDIVVFDLGTKKVLEGYNDTIIAGTNDVVTAIQDEIKKDAGIAPNPEWIEQALRQNKVMYFNKREYDLAGMAAERENSLGEIIASRVARRWSDIQKKLKVVYLAGGGALLAQAAMSKIAPCEVVSDCQYANAVGYLLKGLGKKELNQDS